MPMMAVAAVAAPIIGGVIGNIASAGDRKKAEAAMREAVQIIDSVGAPPDLSREIIYQKLQQVGVMTPELEQAIDVGISKVEQIQEDPTAREAQVQALQAMSQLGKTGIGAEDRAALNQIRSEVQRDAEAKRQQIIQQAQMRGQAGAGAELAAQLLGAQAAADRSSAEGDRIAAQAADARRNALQQLASQSHQLRDQDFNVAQAKAKAADAFRQFDVQNQMGVQQRNVSSKNQAQQRNLEEAQRISDANTQQANQEKLRQAEAQRQYWADQLDLAKSRSGARSGMQNYYTGEADRTARMWQGIGYAAGQGATAFGGSGGKV
jgi:hypothetical protein